MAFRVSQRPANFLSIGDEKVDVGITAHQHGILVRILASMNYGRPMRCLRSK